MPNFALTDAAFPKYLRGMATSKGPHGGEEESWLFPATAQCVIAGCRVSWTLNGITWASSR